MNNYLSHHGILGQKWGVRRFQNKDGSYTSVGRSRHADDQAKFEDRVQATKEKAVSKVREFANLNKLTDEQKATIKKYAIAGAAVVATALATYGAYKVSKVVKNITPYKSLVGDLMKDRQNDKFEVKHLLDAQKVKDAARQELISKFDVSDFSANDLRSGLDKIDRDYEKTVNDVKLARLFLDKTDKSIDINAVRKLQESNPDLYKDMKKLDMNRAMKEYASAAKAESKSIARAESQQSRERLAGAIKEVYDKNQQLNKEIRKAKRS